jgi:hypothetical protein
MLLPLILLAAAIIALGLLNAAIVKGILRLAVPPGME